MRSHALSVITEVCKGVKIIIHLTFPLKKKNKRHSSSQPGESLPSQPGEQNRRRVGNLNTGDPQACGNRLAT